LVRVTLCAALVVPTVWLAKDKLVVDRVATGVPGNAKFAVTLCGAFIVTVVEALLELATLPVQPVKV
jgi:hypothetical protein